MSYETTKSCLSSNLSCSKSLAIEASKPMVSMSLPLVPITTSKRMCLFISVLRLGRSAPESQAARARKKTKGRHSVYCVGTGAGLVLGGVTEFSVLLPSLPCLAELWSRAPAEVKGRFYAMRQNLIWNST